MLFLRKNISYKGTIQISVKQRGKCKLDHTVQWQLENGCGIRSPSRFNGEMAMDYRKTSSISRTKSQSLNVSCIL